MTEQAILSINQSQLEAVITKAIIESITPQARDQLLASTVDHLMSQPARTNSNYSDKRTNLQIAFDHAVINVAERVTREQLETDPRLKTAIQSLIDPMVAGLLEEDYHNKYKLAMGRALADALTKKD